MIVLSVDVKHLLINFIELGIMAILFKKASKIYGHIKVMEFGLEYENSVKIFDLLFNVVIQAHVFVNLLLFRLLFFLVPLRSILLITGSKILEFRMNLVMYNM